MSDLDNALRDLLDGFQSRLQVWPATLGDGNGNVAVPNLVKRVYVRMPDGHAAIVFNDDRVPLTNNLPIVVGYDYINPNLFQVLGVRQTYKSNETGGFSSLGMHHESHEYLADHGGQDVVNAHARQLLPSRLTVISGLKVGVYSSPVHTSAGWKSAALYSIDLAAHVPGSGARYVLVSQALDGSLVATDGATVPIRTYLQWNNIPTPATNERPLGAVVLEAGQTTITEDRDRQDIVDLRFPTFRSWAITSANTAQAVGPTSASGSGMEAAAWDHVHRLPIDATLQWTSGSLGTSGSGGGGAPLSDAIPIASGSPGLPGTSGSASRGDHVHPTTGLVLTGRTLITTAPLTGGGDLSADRTLAISAATSASAGSMSAADKSKLDGIAAGATNTPLSSATPASIGVANAGTSASAAKGDHVHDDPIWLDTDMYGFVLTPDLTSQTTIAFDGTNTFTLAPSSGSAGSWSYYRQGVRHTITGAKTATLSGSPPAAKGLYYIYIDSTDGTLTSASAGWSLEDSKVPVATVAWDNALTPKYWLSDERHTCQISRRFHWEHHFADGSEIISAPSLTGPAVAPAVPVDTNNTMAIGETIFSDEDLKHTLSALANPDATTAKYVVMFRSSGAWNWEASIMPYRFTAAGYIQYDNAGTMTQIGSGDYVNTYLLVTNMGDTGAARFVFIHSQAKYATLALAQAETFASLTKTGLPINEYIAVYQFTWGALAAYGTSGKCRLAATPVRMTVSAAGISTNPASDHNSLTGLQGGTAGEYYHLTSAQKTALTTATQIGQVLYSIDGSTFTVRQPLTDSGWLVDENSGVLLVVDTP